jgi:alkanesulfonate monooxygenase SsuD/methylene tetrahydromethanopterin reductase-like flavin-dependent oxidoreductase (luciferase family)
MDVGIGLPNAVAETTGDQLTDWAKAAEDAGFSSLGTIDRIAYGNFDPMSALAAAATVTERIRLATTVMLAPLRANAAMIAKQALSLDALAGGDRVTLGLAVGGREDDYEVSGLPMEKRGAWFDDALGDLRKILDGDGELQSKVGPRPKSGGPELILGGSIDTTFERAARHGEGWIMGGGTPDQFAEGLEKLKAAWEKEGRDGEPQSKALAYFALGEDGESSADSYLHDYYAFLGKETSDAIAGSAATDAETVKVYASAFEEAGCGELFFMPCSSDSKQVELLAEATGN